jgi:hypothetical protein
LIVVVDPSTTFVLIDFKRGMTQDGGFSIFGLGRWVGVLGRVVVVGDTNSTLSFLLEVVGEAKEKLGTDSRRRS